MRPFLVSSAPFLFVLLWSTGFIGSKLGAPYADPMVFLSVRFLAVLPCLVLIGLFLGARWPKDGVAIGHCIVTGMLVHGIYLGGIFWAIDQGMPAGASAIVVGLQPVLSAVTAAALLSEQIRPKHWAGLVLGGLGLVLVLGPKLQTAGSGIGPATIGAAFIAVLAISIGTVYQKRFVPNTDLLAATFWQYIGALAVTLPLSAAESWTIEWSGQFLFALGWLVAVLSIGAILLLMLLIRQGAVSQVASLFYLVPVATAIESYFLFGEVLMPIQIAGMALVVGAVLIIRSRLFETPN
ncbi:peptide ABC transporter ATP-binding protein [Roseibium aquae]|uniref:Peptide ABC transporter ATP-binding protein n=1 Tax=Roseibium aquae TaxID=1323746 RepID=A0A916TNI8_9HYPH|nr:DMT family transporter [Roseibium aquae]GGB61591.1 peptide ABC transporter ATP-binding protein [Roseibium aquae]